MAARVRCGECGRPAPLQEGATVSRTLRIHMSRICSEVVQVTIPDGLTELETEEAIDNAIDAAMADNHVSLCLHCTGLKSGATRHRDLSDAVEFDGVEDTETGELIRTEPTQWSRVVTRQA